MGTRDTGASATVTFTIQNTGTGILNVAASLVPVSALIGEFTLTNVPDSVPPGGSATLDVIFSPKAGGTRTATLSLANNDISGGENPYVLTLSGIGNPVGEIEIHDPDGYVLENGAGVYDFGTVGTGTGSGNEKSKTFTIFNRGAGTLSTTALSSTPSDLNFVLTGPAATSVPPGASTTFSIKADPQSTGPHTATISVASSDSDEATSTFNVAVVGGNAAEIVVQQPAGTTLVDAVSAVSFGGVLVDGSTNVLTFTLKNIGHSHLTAIAASITGTNASEFVVSTLPTTLEPDASTTFTVTFNPTAYGLRSATLNIASSDSDENPFTIALSGSGTIAGGLATYQQASVVVGQADFDDQVDIPSTSVTRYPAGCAVSSSGRLAICDPQSHCVRIWNSVPTSSGAACDLTLGTVGVFGTSSTRFANPYGIAWGGSDLFVCDSGNNRVLRFSNPETNGQAADLVVGQTAFNLGSAATTQSRLNFPFACAVFSGKLIVCDQANNRVMIWNTIPITNGANASFVLGQGTGTSRFTTSTTGSAANRFYSPEGVCVSPTTGRMYVVDRVNQRVCVWSSVPSASGVSATGLLGLPAFGNVLPGADSTLITQPQGVAVSNAGFVAVSNLRYVKVWYEEPTLSPSGYGPPAHVILGQAEFNQDTHLPWGNPVGPDSRGFKNPRGVQWYGNDLIVSDDEGKRTLIFKP
jgi:hypothetical protein